MFQIEANLQGSNTRIERLSRRIRLKGGRSTSGTTRHISGHGWAGCLSTSAVCDSMGIQLEQCMVLTKKNMFKAITALYTLACGLTSQVVQNVFDQEQLKIHVVKAKFNSSSAENPK